MKVVEKITQRFLKEGIINDDDVDVVVYGLENLIATVCGLLIFLAIGHFFVSFIHAFVIWLACFMLRKNAGGYHADTRKECFLLSILIILLAYLLCEYTRDKQGIMCGMNIILSVVIFLYAPIDSKNKKLDKEERDVYRKRTRIILGLYEVIFWAAMLREKTVLCMDISVVVCIVGSLVCLGKINSQEE